MKKFINFFSCWVIISIAGQNQKYHSGDKYNMIIKSPDAGQISKHIDIPSGTYTGVTGIDIPIYNIKAFDYDLPISLNYHTSGVKVKEMASKVGLGWSLSIGGISLSKQIIGGEDKGKPLYINPNSDLFKPNNNGADNYLARKAVGYDMVNGNGLEDSQPDIYSYSLVGASGKFYFDTSRKVIKIPQNDIKIQNNYEMVDVSGNRYIFKEANIIRNLGGAEPSDNEIQNITDYSISKIILHNGEEISFKYKSISYDYYNNYYKGLKRHIAGSTGVFNQNSYTEYPTKTQVIYEDVIEKITFKEGTIEFNYGNRLDIPGGEKLERIIVKNNYNIIIADYIMNYSYFDSSDTANLNYVSQAATLQKRLKLSSLINQLNQSKHTFNYFEQYSLPNRFSDQTDFLGFYNGSVNNKGISYVLEGDKVYGFGDNKKPNLDYAKSAALKTITYPTGGKMDIEYELDDFYFEGLETEIESKGFTGCGDGSETMLNSGFTVNTVKPYVDFKFTFNSPYSPIDDGSGSLPIGTYVVAEILDQNNNVLKQFLVNQESEVLLEKKDLYKIRFRKIGTDNLDNSNPMPCLVLQWFEVNSTYKEYNKSIGGLRIKSFQKSDGSNNLMKTEFQYKLENGKSSGGIVGDPIDYQYTYEEPCTNGTTLTYDCTNKYQLITNSGNFNITTVNGKATLYDRVITKTINVSNPSQTYTVIDNYFNSGMTNLPSFKNSMMFTFDSNHYDRGLLLKKEIYNSQNTLIKKIENQYDFDYYFNQFSNDYSTQQPTRVTMKPYYIWIKAITNTSSTGTSVTNIPIFDYDRYEIISSWVKNISTKTTNYFNNQNVMETTEYFYDSNYRHLNPIKQKVTFSDLSLNETNYKYAHEKANQKLIDANMIGIPLETSTVQKKDAADVSGKLISKNETRYDNPANLFPTSVLSYDLQNGTNLSTEVTYDKYDSKGNLQQYTTKDGISTTIVWGYNSTQPIAKIVGATYNQVSSLISAMVTASDSDAQLSTDASEQALILALNSFRNDTALAAYQISTYTYDPLIGVRSITPPSGIREVYIYDTSNRLKEIRENDATGKLLKEFKYNYKN